ncbi:hypothetical protein FXO37_01477 [Capsicum annuum]|nr:hypothetical protein FXO37_01477 [Capsicum annuum]
MIENSSIGTYDIRHHSIRNEYVVSTFECTDKSIANVSTDDVPEDAYFDENRSPIHKHYEDIEGCSVDIGTAILDPIVEAVVIKKSDYANVETSVTGHIHKHHPHYNHNTYYWDDYSSTIPESAQAELGAIMEGLVIIVDEIPHEVVIPTKEITKQHSISDSQIPLDFSDAVVVAHQAAKTPAKRTMNKSKDYGAFVAGYVEYLSEGMDVPSVDFEVECHCMQYASLLWNYGLHKVKKCPVSNNDDLQDEGQKISPYPMKLE